MAVMHPITTITPIRSNRWIDPNLRRALKRLGFTDFRHMSRYDVPGVKVYFMASAIEIPNRRSDLISVTDFLIMCVPPARRVRSYIECISARIIRYPDLGSPVKEVEITRWADEGPFPSKDIFLRDLLSFESEQGAIKYPLDG